MMRLKIHTLGLLGIFCFVHSVSAQTQAVAECQQWINAKFAGKQTQSLDAGLYVQANHDPVQLNARAGRPLKIRAPYTIEPPFSFNFDGQSSAALLPQWEVMRTNQKLDSQKTQTTVRYFDKGTGLEVKCVSVAYNDFPTVEWTVYFKNLGTKTAPILSDIQAFDSIFDRGGSKPTVLHHHKGTFVRPDDFQPLETELLHGHPLRFTPPAGRPLGHVFPYFNLAWQPNEGVIVVVGWPGQWSATFNPTSARSVRITSGQEITRLTLKPGEEIRTPLMVLQFWSGDWITAQNTWRRWMFAHNLPKPEGRSLAPQMAACSSHQYGEMINADDASQIMFVDRYIEEKLPLDYWWMDAGWYVHYGKGWPQTGTWEVDKTRYPKGLRYITDHAHNKNVRSIVWFEPERVTPGTFLYTNNPAWLLGSGGGQKLLNLGHAEARQWLVNHVDSIINQEGIDLYRQDYNIDPLSFWRNTDAPDRQGITENHYVTGYLAYWDELLRRHPQMLIDTCASGGHRNDLETLRRSIPLLRSDYLMEPISQQCHTYGLAFWIPFFGTGTSSMDPYEFRSQMCPHFTACFDMRRKDLPFDVARRLLNEWKSEIAPNYFGDFYPLTPYSLSNDLWMAWQFNRPEVGAGVIQAFRRTGCVYESARFPLRGLDRNARYIFTDLDEMDAKKEFSGAELMDQGLPITIHKQPVAKVVVYKRNPPW